jgi:carbon-monoxide dehydrogenase medium subunit
MYSFGYERPTTIAAAAGLLKQNPDNKLLAGGQTLIPTLKQRLANPAALVDLSRIPQLRGIETTANGVRIGAMIRHAEVAASDVVKAAIPALAALAAGIGDPAVRHQGTLGGSLANNDPAADYPAAVLALNATIYTDSRTIAAEDFFQGMFTTALNEGEIVTAVEFPKPKRAGYAKFPNPASRYALAGVFVAETATGIRVAVTGARPAVFRATEIEAALGRSFSAAALENVAVPEDGLNADLHASAKYRAALIRAMAQRAVEAAG